MKKHAPAAHRNRVVFLFDIDNTLLDHDRVTADLRQRLDHEVGKAGAHRYFAMFEELRDEMGYADYLGALQRYRNAYPRDFRLLAISSYLIDYPFANRLYPNSLDALARAQQWGPTALLTDGDVVFQPRKAERSGLLEAVSGRVLIYVHKELELDDVETRLPSEHYVVVDDKLRILAAIKKVWGRRVTTVFPRQGHYALDKKIIAECPPADITLERIGDFLSLDLSTLLAAGKKAAMKAAPMGLSYALGWRAFRLMFASYFRWRVFNPERVPLQGPVILASNHASFLNPPLVGSAVHRQINYLARESLFDVPVAAAILRSWRVVPVDRDGGTGRGLRVILDRLESGGAIILFPEGTRTPDGRLQPAKSGAGLAVIKSNAPVVPVRVFGTFEAYGREMRVPRPRRVMVKYGHPMPFTALRTEAATCPRARLKEIYQEVSDQIMAAIAKLEPEKD